MKIQDLKAKDYVKLVTGAVITIGVEVIVESALMLILPKSTNVLKKAAVFVGSWAIALAISDKAQQYADTAVDVVDGVVQAVKGAVEEQLNEET